MSRPSHLHMPSARAMPMLPLPTQQLRCAKKPVTTMLTYPWKCTVLHCNHMETTGADDLTL